MRGIAYGVGVGPGDPELMTQKAVRLIRENDVIAFPGREPGESVAYRIAAEAVPELPQKELVALNMPMLRDRAALAAEHRSAARLLERYLDQGRNVVFLTLGDPTLYCTFSYLQHFLEADGYASEPVPGVTSFCAAAARLNTPLAEWDEQVHIIPASHGGGSLPDGQGSCVLMKPAGRMTELKRMLKESGRRVMMVENCSMENERIYRTLEEFPDDPGYFSLIIARK